MRTSPGRRWKDHEVRSACPGVALADSRIDTVIGLDANAPAPELAALFDGVEQVRADAGTANGVVADLDAEVVVHLALLTAPDPNNGGRAAIPHSWYQPPP